MRRLFLAAVAVLAVSGVASAQQPYPAQLRQPTVAPGAAAATPVVPASGATVIKGDGGCTDCGSTAKHGFKMSGGHGSGGCALGYGCQNGCGSVKSDLAFHFGSCRQFFSPCGPSFGHGGLFGSKCPTQSFAQPWGQGWTCPRAYDSYTNH